LRPVQKDLICDSLNYCVEKKGLEIFAYVIMSSHLHLLARAENGDLSSILRDFKKFTATQLIKSFRYKNESRREWMVKLFDNQQRKQTSKSKHQVWQYNNHAVETFSARFTLSKINYIHQNPVVAGIVNKADQYPYSSAQDYSGETGPVKVSLLNLHSLII